MILETFENLTAREEIRPDGKYVVYSDKTGIDVFTYNDDLVSSFQQTDEERKLGISLCLKARLDGHWKGDILHPEPYSLTK